MMTFGAHWEQPVLEKAIVQAWNLSSRNSFAQCL